MKNKHYSLALCFSFIEKQPERSIAGWFSIPTGDMDIVGCVLMSATQRHSIFCLIITARMICDMTHLAL